MPKRKSPDPPPEFIVDRCLGKSIVFALREAGLHVRSLAEVYGEQEATLLADTVWLEDAGRQGWIILTKDNAIRRRPAERQALIDAGARVFCITTAQLTGAAQIERLLTNRNRILLKSRKRGPFIFGVLEKSLVQIYP